MENIVKRVLEKVAVDTADSASMFFCYEPEVPETLKEKTEDTENC